MKLQIKKEYRLISALCANILIIILEVIALILSLIEHGLENFLFYTQDSNYLAMAASAFFCVYAMKELRGKSEMLKWVHSLRYISVSCLMVYSQPWYMSVIWCIVILGIAGALAFAVRSLHNLIYKRKI